jgi:hypothetical protein
MSETAIRLVIEHPNALASVLLVLVVLLSTLPYLSRLGFYSDDWAFLALMKNSSHHSVADLIRAEFTFNANLQMRPLQVAYQATLFSLFGLNPFGYHVVNALVLGVTALLFYAVSREFQVPAPIAVSGAALFALMPNYSTDRFWFAAFGYTLTLAFYFLSLYGDLRAVRSRSSASLMGWKLLALAALAMAALGYEVVIPLLAANMVVIWLRAKATEPRGLVARLGVTGAVLYVAIHYVVLVSAIAFKATTAFAGGTGLGRFYLVRLLVGPLMVNLGTYGIGLPLTFVWALRNSSTAALLVSVVIGVAVFACVMSLTKADVGLFKRMSWRRLAFAGIGVYVLGYAVFVTTVRYGISSSGINNRINIGGAAGVALTVVAVLGWVASRLRSPRRASQLFASTMGTLCIVASLTVSALAASWATAWQREQRILDVVRVAIPTMSSGTNVILSGTCPYVGPAIVFESPWDLRGALQLLYRDPSLNADVVTPRMTVTEHGLRTSMYGLDTHLYPFSSQILLVDARRGRVLPLRTADEAKDYLSGTAVSCQPGMPGRGVIIFPIDRLYVDLEARGFRPWRS